MKNLLIFTAILIVALWWAIYPPFQGHSQSNKTEASSTQEFDKRAEKIIEKNNQIIENLNSAEQKTKIITKTKVITKKVPVRIEIEPKIFIRSKGFVFEVTPEKHGNHYVIDLESAVQVNNEMAIQELEFLEQNDKPETKNKSVLQWLGFKK